jgi:hypothetical protein
LQKALDCEEDIRLLIVSELLMGDPAQTLVNKHASHVWSKVCSTVSAVRSRHVNYFPEGNGVIVDTARTSDLCIVSQISLFSESNSFHH